MSYLNWLWLCLTSQRGEVGDEDEGQSSGSGEGSAEGQKEGQGNHAAVAEEGSQAGEIDINGLTKERDEWKTKHETLSGQSRATERNLASTREALKANGLQLVQDSDGNMKVMPITRSTGTRFTDEHKNKFFSYFPDAKSGEDFLGILNAMLDDRFDGGFKNFRSELQQEQSFYGSRNAAIKEMFKVYPDLNPDAETYNKGFYDLADKILGEKYWDAKTNRPLVPNADLIAAHEAAIQLRISPTAVAAAKREGFEQGKTSKKIVGAVQGSQGQSGSGFKKLNFAEYSKLTPEQKGKYDKEDIESRKVK